MPELNADVPLLRCLVRRRYLHDLDDTPGMVPAAVFGVASVPGRALMFHALLEDGAQIARLPLSALASREDAPELALDVLQLWDCLSANVAVLAYEYLAGMRCRATLKDRRAYEGRYLFTVDWHGSTYADDPGDLGHKCAHVLALDNGCFCAQPNNRTQWFDPAFVTRPFDAPPGYKTNTHVWKAETERRWRSEDSPRLFYDVEVNGSTADSSVLRCATDPRSTCQTGDAR